jgi:serine/threonine-protein kinase
VAADARQAWDGPHPDHPRLPIHVEAGAWQGKPVSFELRGPWDEEAIPETPYARRADVAMVLFTAVVALVVGTGVLMAWRNLAAGRGDRRGALRLGLFVFGITLLCHLLTSHVPPLRSGVIDSLWSATRLASAAAVCLSTFYLAAEPHVRRRWPRLLVSWSRMIGGDFRDPLVGRDVLAGALLGVAHTTTIYSAVLVEKLATSLKERSLEFRAELLASPLHALAGVLGSVNSAITAGFLNLLLILLLLLLLRRERLVMVAFFAVYVTLDVLFFARSWVYAVPVLLIPLLATAASLRFGLLTTMVFHLTFLLTFFMAFTTRLSAWYFGRGLVPLAATVLLALWGGWVALGPQKLFAADEV